MRAPHRPLARALTLAFALTLALPGCVDAIDERLRAANVEPPRWEVGDWWTYRVTSDLYGTDAEVNVTVAEVNGSIYLMGYPDGSSPVDALLFHMPAYGPVRDDLSWEVHGEQFHPAAWPLEDGKEWDTKWISADVHFKAELIDGKWIISNAGFESAGGLTYNLTYDPEVEWFTNFTRVDPATGALRQGIELIAHGQAGREPVRAPTQIEVVFLESRTGGAFPTTPAPGVVPAPPTPSFTREEGNQTLLVGCIIGGAGGRYQAEVTSPSGTVACSRTDDVPTQDPNYRVHVAEVPNEAGTWTTRLLALGQGSATAEVLAYPVKAFTAPGVPSTA